MSIINLEIIDPITGSYIINSLNGIWNSYGCPVNNNQGLSLYLEDNNTGDSSLIDLAGFDRSRRQLGLLKDSKEVFELVVMLPMLYTDIEYTEEPPAEPSYTPPDPCAPCEDKLPNCQDISNVPLMGQYSIEEIHRMFGLPEPSGPFWNSDSPIYSSVISSNAPASKKQNSLVYSRTEDAWLFTISEEIVNKILDVQDYKKLSIVDIKNILDTKKNLNNNNNIVKLMKAMIKYNFPPHLNWLLFPDKLQPFCMYVAEFSTVLSKNDLSNIWQGTMPSIAENPQEQEITIEHFLTDEEMFGGFDIANIDNIKLSVFKCKMRAENNYYNMLAGASYPLTKDAIQQNNERNKWYQYNWPYDNFSLVELLKIEGGEVREFISPEDISETVFTTIETPEGTIQTQASKKDYNAYVASNASYTPSLYK